jgi:hypothetical protein
MKSILFWTGVRVGLPRFFLDPLDILTSMRLGPSSLERLEIAREISVLLLTTWVCLYPMALAISGIQKDSLLAAVGWPNLRPLGHKCISVLSILYECLPPTESWAPLFKTMWCRFGGAILKSWMNEWDTTNYTCMESK